MRVALLAAVAWLAVPAFAQTANGVVYGFDGQPCGGACVHVRGAGFTTGEVLTDARGAFAIDADRPFAQLVVQLEGVVVRVPAAAGSAREVAVRFADQAFATLHGTVLDPAGDPARAVDLQMKDAGGNTLGCVTTTDDGSFTFRTKPQLQRIVVDPVGWHCEVDGPFTDKSPVRIDLTKVKDEFVRLQGHCFDEQDRPAAAWTMTARRGGVRLAMARVGADGAFTLWCRGTVDEVDATDGFTHVGLVGPWRSNARLLLRERDHGLVPVVGRVVGADGAAIVGAAIVPAMDEATPPKSQAALATTDSDGRFVARVRRGQPFLFAYHDISNRTGTVAVPRDGAPVVVTVR
ncbi:MAG: carboxypeptidase regulatory-like domain-containing protein [Planctomycetes bacterium]|nr:carboxypeptidase regulatory-like domain-containing protein [Planctomycetota bacterium]